MSLINLSIKHGQTLDEARRRMGTAVEQIHGKFPTLVDRVEWSADRTGVTVLGKGFDVTMRVDAQDLHVTGNLTILGGLLGGPVKAGLKQILSRTFQRRLP